MCNSRFLSFIGFFLLWPLLLMGQSHDFMVQDFHENTTDLSAATSGIVDKNGAPGILLRFAVRDPQFEVEGNLGNLAVEHKTGELWVYVPQGTKRLDIRHPRLGIIRGYEIPIKLKAKTTYDAEIVATGNAPALMQDDIGHEPPRSVEPDKTNTETNVSDNPVSESYDYLNDKPDNPYKHSKKSFSLPEVHFILNAGFNVLSPMGPMVGAGLEIGKFFIGGDYTFGISKVEGVGIYYKLSGKGEALGEAYNYSASRASVRLGLNFSPKASVQVVPHAGVSFTMIKGDEITNLLGNDSQFDKCNTMSAFVGVNFLVKLSTGIFVYATPQYNFAVGSNEVYKVIKETDSKLKAWGEGFGVSAGLLFRF